MLNNNFGRPDAVAWVKGGEEFPEISGNVRFFQRRDGVLVVANISGLPQNDTGGFFAFHIHEGNACTGKDFADTGTHFNPKNSPHPMHEGDLPSLISNNGRAYFTVMTNRFRVRDIIGKTVVIHDNADDFRTQPSGNSGMKIACGVIRRSGCC